MKATRGRNGFLALVIAFALAVSATACVPQQAPNSCQQQDDDGDDD